MQVGIDCAGCYFGYYFNQSARLNHINFLELLHVVLRDQGERVLEETEGTDPVSMEVGDRILIF